MYDINIHDENEVRSKFKSSNSLELTKYLFENAREFIDLDSINYVFQQVNKVGIIKFIFENASNLISSNSIIKAFESSDKNVIKYLLTNWQHKTAEFANIDHHLLQQKITHSTLNQKITIDTELWDIIEANNLFLKPPEATIIAFNNYNGHWSENLLFNLSDLINYTNHKDNYYLHKITIGDSKNEKYLSIYDGFINPGLGDTFPIEDEFNVKYLSDDKHHREMEYSYQRIITYAKEHNKPYIGICSGAQHLILNEGGYITKTPNHNHVPHKFIAENGSIVHFMAMNKHEQSAAIVAGYFPEIEFDINTQHNYAGVKGKISHLELGGQSDEGVIQAVARNFYQLGYQFHPENICNTEDDMIFSRNKNLLFNFLKIINLSKYHNIEIFSNKLWGILANSYQSAKCPATQEICPKTDMLMDVLGDNFLDLSI